MRLVKIKEGQQFKFFFASYTIDVHAKKFQSIDKFFLLVPINEDLVFFPFVKRSKLF